MIRLTAIVSGKPCTMLTGESIAQAARSCRDRFGDRFDGFGVIPVEVVARSKWEEYRAKAVTRAELEAWLAGQDDEQEIRAIFNGIRG